MEFARHFSRRDLDDLFEGFSLPEDFMFGVANAPYQVEGGYNGHGEPLNNWVEFERSEKVEPSGEAISFWTEYPEEIEMAKGMGLNAFRLGIEWARVQPETSTSSVKAPPFDRSAIEAYADMIASIMRAGMEPVVTLHHFTHPYWCGLDFWLANGELDHFRTYVREVVRGVNTLLVDKHSLRPVRYWITLNEPNAWGFLTYVLRAFPRRKTGLRHAIAALDNMIDAHCRAYDTVHQVYEEEGWERPRVTYNTICLSVYGFDKMVTDLLNARRNQVERQNLGSYLRDGQEAWVAEIAKCPVISKPVPGARLLEKFISQSAERRLTPERFPNAIKAIYGSENPQKLDYLALDFYDPFICNMVKPPTLQDFREGRVNFNAEHWEWVLNPRAMYHFLKAQTINGQGLPVLIAENGLCHKIHKGRVSERADAATRDIFLQAFLYEAMRALKDGVPLIGYLYWSMIDNYEWGSFEPRFGLFTVDRTRTPAKISSVDAWGTDAAGAYGAIIGALRSGDAGRMAEAFTADDL
jgi:beta-glucosidase